MTRAIAKWSKRSLKDVARNKSRGPRESQPAGSWSWGIRSQGGTRSSGSNNQRLRARNKDGRLEDNGLISLAPKIVRRDGSLRNELEGRVKITTGQCRQSVATRTSDLQEPARPQTSESSVGLGLVGSCGLLQLYRRRRD